MDEERMTRRSRRRKRVEEEEEKERWGLSHQSGECHDKSVLQVCPDVVCQGVVCHGMSSFVFFKKWRRGIMEGGAGGGRGKEEGRSLLAPLCA